MPWKKIGEQCFCLSLKRRVERLEIRDVTWGRKLWCMSSFFSLLRCKSCFHSALRCLCSVKHVAGRNGVLTKMSVEVYGETLLVTRVNMRIIVNIPEITAIPGRLRFPGGAASPSGPVSRW